MSEGMTRKLALLYVILMVVVITLFVFLFLNFTTKRIGA